MKAIEAECIGCFAQNLGFGSSLFAEYLWFPGPLETYGIIVLL